MLRRVVLAASVVLVALSALIGALDAANIGPYRVLQSAAWFPPPNLSINCAGNNIPAITTSRASTVFQPDLNGLLHSFSSNVLAITNVGCGSWLATTNEAKQSRDWTQAVWVAANITAAHTATGADGAANAATKLTAGAGNGTILQTFTVTSEEQVFSVYVQRVTGVGEVDITENNGTTWTPLNSSICSQPGTGAPASVVSTGYVRCFVQASLANPVIGVRIVTNGDAINVDLAQLETNTVNNPTAPVATTSAAVARAADVLTLTTVPALSTAWTVISKVTHPFQATAISRYAVELSDNTNNNRIVEQINITPNLNTFIETGGVIKLNAGSGIFLGSSYPSNVPISAGISSPPITTSGVFGSSPPAKIFVSPSAAGGGSTPTISKFNIGSAHASNLQTDGYVQCVYVWTTYALSPAQLNAALASGCF